MFIVKKKKKALFIKYKKPLKVYKLKEFEDILSDKGFKYHHQNGSHRIYIDESYHYITVPKKKEVNAMLSTVILQRIARNDLKTIDNLTIQRYQSNMSI